MAYQESAVRSSIVGLHFSVMAGTVAGDSRSCRTKTSSLGDWVIGVAGALAFKHSDMNAFRSSPF
jgi:hypothetical protein